MFFAYLHILKLRNNILCCLVQILCTLLSDGFSKCAYCKIIKELLHTRETNVISRLRKTRPLISRQLWLYFNFSFAINEGDKISKMCWQINLQNLCVHVSNNLSEICFVYNQNMIGLGFIFCVPILNFFTVERRLISLVLIGGSPLLSKIIGLYGINVDKLLPKNRISNNYKYIIYNHITHICVSYTCAYYYTL